MLSCSRGLDQKTLHSRGLPQELKDRLERAIGYNTHWMSLLGNSKQHVFNNGISWTNRRKRGKRSRALVQADKVQLEAMMLVASGCGGSASGSCEVTLEWMSAAAPDATKVPTPIMNGVKLFL